jgi:hypothetical protein
VNRLPWIVVGLVALLLLGFLFWYTPERRAARPVNGPVTAEAEATPGEAVGAVAAPPTARAPASRGDAPPKLVPPTVDAGPPEPQGPQTVELGTHTVYLKDETTEKRVMRFELRVTVSNAAGATEARLRRDDLVRMAFFLGSHRVAEGALGEAGRDRFANDLLERYRNVIRLGTVDAVELARYEVLPAAKVPPRTP